jgi:hypothetical protein
MTELPALLGVLAGVAGVVNTLPYIGDTLRGTTRPHRGTWFVWALLAVVVCFSQRADGASWSLLMGAGQAVLTGVVFVLAVRRGEGSLRPAEALTLAVAAGGVLGWLLADEPLVATACVIVADLLAAAMMVPKAYRDPGSETLVSFAGAGLAGALAAAAVGAPDVSLLCYPVYFCLVNAGLAVLIHHRRAVLGATALAA